MNWMEYSLAVLTILKDSGPMMFAFCALCAAVTIIMTVNRTNKEATRRAKIEAEKGLEEKRISMTRQIPVSLRRDDHDV